MTPKLTTNRLVLREIKVNDIFGVYEIFTDSETMKLFGGSIFIDDIKRKDFVLDMKIERENGISYFWAITLKEEKEFIGFVRLMSYKSWYYDASFSAMGEYRNNPEVLQYFDRINGWEIDYALLKNQRNKGIMKEALSSVIEFCKSENLSPIYAKLNSMNNIGSAKVLVYNNFKEYQEYQEYWQNSMGWFYIWKKNY